MKKKLGTKILSIVLIIFLVFMVTKNALIKSVITLGAGQVTGCKVQIDKFAFGVFKQGVHMKGFRLFNPKGFPKEPMVEINEITVEYDLPALLTGKIHLPLLVLDLEQMTITTNKDGLMNVDEIKVVKQSKEEQPDQKAEAPKKEKKPSKPMKMQIDKVSLSLGKVIVKDYTKMNGDEPSLTVVNSGVKDATYENITSAQQLATLVLATGMKSAAIKSAGMYAATSLLGVGFLPAGVAGVLLGNAEAAHDFSQNYKTVYATALDIIKKEGEVKTEDMAGKMIKAKVDGADVSVQFETVDGQTRVTIAAKKFMIPKAQLSEQLIYKMTEALK